LYGEIIVTTTNEDKVLSHNIDDEKITHKVKIDEEKILVTKIQKTSENKI